MPVKTFKVILADGTTDLARQLGTFTETVGTDRFRFVITRRTGLPPVLTHRDSTRAIANISNSQHAAATGDWVGAGRLTLRAIIESKGVERVAEALKKQSKSP